MLSYYEAKLQLNAPTQKERYLEEEQAFIDKQFDNTTTIETIQEESAIGTFLFNDIDVRLNHIVSNVTTGQKNGDDFRLILFQDLKKAITQGLYYIFYNNYWLATFTDTSQAKKVVVRRCNNTLKDIDKNGKIIEYPCVIGYDASAFNPYVSQSIITPNNTIVVTVQGNDYTRGLEVNHRILVNGRAFKLAGYNNYMENNMIDKRVDLMIMDFILDTPHDKDDFVNGIAYNGEDIVVPTPTPKEAIIVLPTITEILQGRTINFKAYLSVDGVEMTNHITCTPNSVPMANYELIQVDDTNFKLTNKLRYTEPLVLTFTTVYNSTTITNTLSIKLRAVF